MKIHSSLQLAAIAGLSLSAVSCIVDAGAGTATVTTETYRPGYYVQTLPQYETRVIGGTRYYYHNNVYYRPRGEGYVVVESPRGPYDGTRTEIIRTLPPGYRVVERGGMRYYRAGDTYYRAEGGGYVVVSDPF